MTSETHTKKAKPNKKEHTFRIRMLRVNQLIYIY